MTHPSTSGLLVAVSAFLSTLVPGPAGAQDTVEKVRAFRQAHEVEIVSELTSLARIPNHATDRVNILRNVVQLEAMLERRGISHQRLELDNSPPALLGELKVPGATRTIVFYAHYDGQPVDASQWASDPFEPTLRSAALDMGGKPIDLASVKAPLDPEWRLYARAISDDRAPIIALLSAIDALAASGVSPSVNMKFFFEGEEEFGSPNLGRMLRTHKKKLAADLWIFCDGPVHPSRKQQVVFGVRGVMGLQVTAFGPSGALHSGHYGNWAPNPAATLSNVIASLRDMDGRIKVEGFYDDVLPLGPADREALASVPKADEQLRQTFALANTENNNAVLAERILMPALNVDGLKSANVGAESRNAIPPEAQASFDFRLVPNQTPEHIRELIEGHLEGLGFTVVHESPTLEMRREVPRILLLEWEQGYRALRTPVDSAPSKAVLEVIDRALDEPVIRMPILGGSLPLYLFEDVLDTPLIVVPTVNHDNNQHAPNENLRLQNLWDAIELFASLMAELGPSWK